MHGYINEVGEDWRRRFVLIILMSRSNNKL